MQRDINVLNGQVVSSFVGQDVERLQLNQQALQQKRETWSQLLDEKKMVNRKIGYANREARKIRKKLGLD